jgi:NADPH-dependent 2,4-dienoyl-CoA reductase/sulfur reductase-like enzyme
MGAEEVPHYKYLIVGGGMASDAAVRGIREVDAAESIGVIGSEIDPPYKRPPLSKGLWKGDPLESIWYKTEDRGVTLHLGRTVRDLDPLTRRVIDDAGAAYTYEYLLLATGGIPRRLPFGGDRILYFRSVGDYRRLREMAERGRRFAVIGGGFIGSEIAAALAMIGKEVVMVFPGDAVCGHLFPPDLARYVTGYYRQKGVEVLAGESVAGVQADGEGITLHLHNAKASGERKIRVDGVVAGIGIEPDVDLARKAGLDAGNGILVDERLRTTHPSIYAAGDAASFYNPALGKRLRVEHEDNAKTMGRLAGRAMAGEPVTYHHLPFFYSDLFELGYEAVGETDARHETVADWKEPFRKGVVYYMEQGRVRGVLLWNVWDQVDVARRLIAEPGPFRPEDLKGRLLDREGA